MEKNPQDQNLADAPDDQSKPFNPNNAYSEPKDKEATGPFGSPEAVLQQPLGEEKIIYRDEEHREARPDEIHKPAVERGTTEATNAEKLSAP
jgi:hypothetical protein